jgi:hypothetical protein
VYGVACSSPLGSTRLAVATAAGTAVLRLPQRTNPDAKALSRARQIAREERRFRQT